MNLESAEAVDGSSLFWKWLVVICVLGLTIRAVRLEDRPFTADETYELTHLSKSLNEVALDPDGFPPTYRWLLSWTVSAFGEHAYRWFPALLGVLVILVTGLAARELGGKEAGLNAALWCAISSHQIDFSQQCRSYSINLLAAAVALLGVQLVRKKSNWQHWAVLVLGSFFALGTHYYAGFFLVFVWSFCLIGVALKHPGSYIASAVVLGVMCMVWVWTLKQDLSRDLPIEHINPFDLTGWAYTYYTLLLGWTLGPSQIELLQWPKTKGILVIAPWALLSLSSVLVIVYRALRSNSAKAVFPLVVILAVTPLVAGLVASAVGTTYVGRYVAWLAVPLALILGTGMSLRGWKLVTVATYVLILFNLVSSTNRWYGPRYDREDYRELASYLEESYPKDGVVIMSHYLAQAAVRHVTPNSDRTEISLGSDEARDWHEQLSKLLSQSQAIEFVFVTDWFTRDSLMDRQRRELLEPIKATELGQFSNTMELFRASRESIQSWLNENKTE